jgi:hypothetical protein
MNYKDLKIKYEKKLSKLDADIRDYKASDNAELRCAVSTLEKSREEVHLLYVAVLKEMNRGEYNGESCRWCANEKNCTYNRRAMEQTREAIANISYSTKAYCSCKCTCDYYVKDKDKYMEHNIGECAG